MHAGMDGENKPRKMAMHGPVRTGPAFYDAYSMAPHYNHEVNNPQ